MRTLLYLFVFCGFLTFGANAQTYYYVTQTQGASNIAGSSVTVTPIAAATSTTSVSCSQIHVSALWIGNSGNPNAYEIAFNAPAKSVRLRFNHLTANQDIRVFVNGVKYAISGAASGLGTISGPGCVTALPATSNGDIVVQPSAPSAGLNAELIINPGQPIDSIRVQHMNGLGNGCYFDVAFEPALYLANLAQTRFCVGDVFQVSYNALSGYFNNGNVFSVQMSDATGSFSNPMTIGTLTSVIPSFVTCAVPTTIPAGTGYRIRIVSSNPAFISDNNGTDITIDRFPVFPKPTSNSPICADETLILTAQNVVPNIDITWQNFNGFSTDGAQVEKTGIEKPDAGKYWIYARYFSCVYTDTIEVVVKYKPQIKAPVAIPTILCQDDTLTLAVTPDPDTLGVLYEWNGPANFYAVGDTVQRFNVDPSASGVYHIVASYNGCAAGDSVNVTVKPKPDSLWASAFPNTLVSGQKVQLIGGAGYNPHNILYQWTGPNGFNSTQQSNIFNVGIKDAGIYFLKADLEGCYRSTFVLVFVHQSPFDEFDLYPNPATDSIHVKGYVERDQVAEIKIFNGYGDFITRKVVATANKMLDVSIPLPGYLSPGLYVIRIYIDQKQRDYRFLINK